MVQTMCVLRLGLTLMQRKWPARRAYSLDEWRVLLFMCDQWARFLPLWKLE